MKKTPTVKRQLPKNQQLNAIEYRCLQSITLASASFERALKRGWKEGTSLLEKGSVEIPADGWDLEAFLILIDIFHARPQKVPKAVSLELLAKVTVLADYYECQESVKFFASKWFNLLDDEPLPKDHRDLMLSLWITWVFKQS
ncbi:hypothetical protein N8T08_006722 [Aspergillus melleus]|uniref:Uncharacterized protein n=1 Tax=Aspergillus melleus TaxID=138277 RepID=A0ACC3AZG0_9EURO|nr:hypothetical protein N8T08_006722 [Aspergillus melleus]